MDSFKEVLRKKGFKATPQRLAVHSAMLSLVHASADMIGDFIAETSKTPIRTSTIYNILLEFSACGIYRCRPATAGKMYFDVDPSRHAHLYDPKTGEFRDVYDPQLMDLVSAHLKRRRFKGYKVDDIDVQLICHQTRKITK